MNVIKVLRTLAMWQPSDLIAFDTRQQRYMTAFIQGLLSPIEHRIWEKWISAFVMGPCI